MWSPLVAVIADEHLNGSVDLLQHRDSHEGLSVIDHVPAIPEPDDVDAGKVVLVRKKCGSVGVPVLVKQAKREKDIPTQGLDAEAF